MTDKTNIGIAAFMVSGIISSILIAGLVSGFAVSAPYMENKQLKLYAGESKNLEFVLQNGGTTDSVTAKAQITNGSQVAEITDANPIYTIPGGGKATVHLRVNAPEGAALNNAYKVHLEFGMATSATGGFSFGSGIGQEFDVVIVNKPPVKAEVGQSKTGNSSTMTAVLMIVAVLIIIFLIWKYKKRNNK